MACNRSGAGSWGCNMMWLYTLHTGAPVKAWLDQLLTSSVPCLLRGWARRVHMHVLVG